MFNCYCISLLIVGFSSSGLTSADQEFTDSDSCKLPPPPNHGGYMVDVQGVAYPQAGEFYNGILMNVTCDPGYSLVGEQRLSCLGGRWSDDVPECVPCGTPPEIDVPNVIGGRIAEYSDMPWHAAVYRKTTKPYMQICGGTVVSSRVVISAAHCFWNDAEKQLPVHFFAIAAGKIYRPWSDPMDEEIAQKSDVQDIKIPPRFQGQATNFQDDIAVVVINTPFTFSGLLKPICLNFDPEMDDRQLSSGQYGTVAGWGLTTEDGGASPILKVVEVPFVPIEQCLMETPPAFISFITSDKICAGYTNGTALCMGDSGGGLVFADSVGPLARYYLRGVVSTAPRNGHLCNAYARTTFTQIIKHERFIKKYLI